MAVSVLAASCLWGQPEPTIRVNVNLIQVDVTVTDKSGGRVTDLKAGDFEVSREGKRQQIKSVIYVPGQRKGMEPTKAGAAQDEPAAGQLKPEEVRRTIAIMIDDLSLSFTSTAVVREALKRFVEENVRSRDLVAVYRASSGLSLMQQFTTNKKQLLASIERLRFGRLKAFDALAPLSTAAVDSAQSATLAAMAEEMQLREEQSNRYLQDIQTAAMLGAVNLAVRGIRELPGRKSLVLLSDAIQIFDAPASFVNSDLPMLPNMPGGVGGQRVRTMTAMRSLVDSANRSGVMIYTVDPRGLVTTSLTAQDSVGGDARRVTMLSGQRQLDFNFSQDGMGMLAEQTGGVFYRNTNDIAGALRKALDDQEGYYLVAFQPDDETFEKTKDSTKFQRLSVKVKRPGVSLRYRQGFFAVAEAEGTALNPLVSAVLSPFRSAEVPMKVTPVYLEAAGTGPFLRTLLHIDAAALEFREEPAQAGDKDQRPWQRAAVNEVVLLFDETGKLVEKVEQPQQIRTRGEGFAQLKRHGMVQELDVRVPGPGAYQVRSAVVDLASQKTGSAAQFVEVPDVKQKRLALSSLVVSGVGWAERKEPKGNPAQRVVKPGGQVEYAVFIYNATAKEARPNLLTQLRLFRDGALIYTGAKTALRPEGLKDLRSLSLTGKLRVGDKTGDYVLELAVQDLDAPAKQQFAVRTMDFTVQAGE